jgi:DNA mismatch endonuclease (patch repair protein)
MGYRYRLHGADLPGAPDIVFPARRAVIFVHGCFWHAHGCPRGRREPKTNAGYWRSKRERNARRDASAADALNERGWRVLVLWECDIAVSASLLERLKLFLGPPRALSA